MTFSFDLREVIPEEKPYRPPKHQRHLHLRLCNLLECNNGGDCPGRLGLQCNIVLCFKAILIRLTLVKQLLIPISSSYLLPKHQRHLHSVLLGIKLSYKTLRLGLTYQILTTLTFIDCIHSLQAIVGCVNSFWYEND